MPSTLAPAELFTLESLVTPTAQGIASRVLARSAAGNITLFAFDQGEELSEHTAPFDALVLTVSGASRPFKVRSGAIVDTTTPAASSSPSAVVTPVTRPSATRISSTVIPAGTGGGDASHCWRCRR